MDDNNTPISRRSVTKTSTSTPATSIPTKRRSKTLTAATELIITSNPNQW